MTFFTVPPRPADEAVRLGVLRDLNILDTGRDLALDAIVDEAARLFGAPIALISLIDVKRQWFKATHGLDAPETPRAISFCGHAILQDEPLVVLDSRHDQRFAGNPLATAAPHVIFYLGIPLVVRGAAIGTLCIIDTTPRDAVDAYEIAAAKALAARVVAHIETNYPSR